MDYNIRLPKILRYMQDGLEPMKDSDDIFELLRLAFVEIRGATTGDRPLSLLILNGLSSNFDTVYAFEVILPALSGT